MKRSFEETEPEQCDFADRIASCCYSKFNELPGRGKPSSNEWTHLAAFVSVDEGDNMSVLSLGTGTKCLGGDKSERGTRGCLLHDSHAEVIARRCLLRLFYEEILSERNSILIKQSEKKFDLNKSVRVYMFVSYAPCGAAAHFSDPIKRPKFEHKSLSSTDGESQEKLYLKPGKGFATTSLSCTNKINRWIYQGLEGTLLNQIIQSPIKPSALVIQSTTDLSSIFKNITVLSASEQFQYGPSSERTRPCPMSIGWWQHLDHSSCVVTVDGYPLGQVKKLRHQPEYANPLAKYSLFTLYMKIMNHLSPGEIDYAKAKSFSSNSLRNQFMLNNPHWLQTDQSLFYSFHSSGS